jgi:CMP-N,N'-diacetyllegionaminic acid synthase
MHSAERVLAVIPARGGSKGLPGKNLRALAGLPLIAHSIRCAKATPEIAHVVVSTDSQAIAEVARAHGVEVPFMRPPELATDETGLDLVLRHAHAEMERACGQRFAVQVLLQPTGPFRLPEDIRAGLALLANDPALDGVVACSEPSFNPFYVGVVERDHLLRPAFTPERAIQRRQDAPRFLRVNGTLYLWRRRWLARRATHWLDQPHRALVIPDLRGVDIDSAEDFELAEWLLATGRVRLPWLERSA